MNEELGPPELIMPLTALGAKLGIQCISMVRHKAD